MTLLFSGSLMAQAVLELDKKEIDFGALSQDTNMAANELIVLKRTAKSPKKIKLKYTIKHMEKNCVAYEVKRKEIKEFSQTVCERGVDGSHECSEMTYSGLYDAETVCTKNGLIRKVTSHELTLDFKRAVKLAPEATETFHVNIKQNKISSESTKLAGKVADSAALYEVSVSEMFNKIKFKAK